MDVLSRYVHQGMTVCDAGSGSGFYSAYFILAGCQVYCIDYATKALELTREATGGKAECYLEGDLLDDAFCRQLNDTFDLIFTDGLFEHFTGQEQVKLMENLVSMKKSGGLVVTFVPNVFSHWELVRRALRRSRRGLKVTENAFGMGRLSQLARVSGQMVVEKGGVNVLSARCSPEGMARWIGSSIYVVSR
jgi:SAM-dependent methyltransferase